MKIWGTLFIAAAIQCVKGYDFIPFGPKTSAPITAKSWNGTIGKPPRPYTAHMAVSADARAFAVAVSNECVGHYITSETADTYGCTWATNGGLFSFAAPPAQVCIGALVVNGTAVSTPADEYASIGLNDSGIILGVGNVYEGYSQFIQGRGYLVRDGESYVNKSSDLDPKSGFVTEFAPRTAIGMIAKTNELVSVVVDGIEEHQVGVSLFEMADILIDQGISHAINLDGGGSSDAVFHGKIFSKPTCHDTPVICERPVTSIACFRQQ